MYSVDIHISIGYALIIFATLRLMTVTDYVFSGHPYFYRICSYCLRPFTPNDNNVIYEKMGIKLMHLGLFFESVSAINKPHLYW